MPSPRTNIFLTDANGNTVINDFSNNNCLNCIAENITKDKRTVRCPQDEVKRRLYYCKDDIGQLFVCDDKEKTSNNFKTLIDLIIHSRVSLIKRQQDLALGVRRSAFRDLDALEHNIAHINSDAINEFYSYITQDTLVTNYRKLQELISKNIQKHPDDAVDLIAKLARYNLNIKTELSVVAKLNNPDSKASCNVGNPRDPIMTSVYMLYPLFHDRKVYVNVSDYWDKFDFDYDALQVASFYIIENATKYTESGSQFNISFQREQHTFLIEFSMRSLFIEELEEELIFNEGFRGGQAQKTKRGGKGIGLYRAKRLARFMGGDLLLEAGVESRLGKDGLLYADNKFVIEIPVRVPIR